MLKRLRLENFKTWRQADVQFGRITGLFGTNSSGKSSILQFLLMMKQTKDATDRAISLNLNGTYAKLGLFKDMIYKHDESRVLRWSIEYDQQTPLHLTSVGEPDGDFGHGNSFRVTSAVSFSEKKQSTITSMLAYEFDGKEFSLKSKEAGGAAFELSANGTSFKFIRNQGRAWQLPGPVKSYAFPDQARTYYQNASFLADLEKSYEQQLDNIFYLGPLREYPQRDYLWARSRPTDVGDKGEKTVDAILAMTAAGEKRNLKAKTRLKPFQEIVAHWLRELGVIFDFNVKEIAKGSNRWQAKVTVRPGGTEVLLTDVGFGVSQVLPVVTLLQYVPEGSTVILEQPEIHLHPLAQANLADVIINAAIHRKVQVILESHSEHLLLRIQRRIAEGDPAGLKSDDVKLYFCEWKDGESKLDVLDLDMFGSIKNWPDKFMGDAFGEVAQAELKRIERRRKMSQ